MSTQLCFNNKQTRIDLGRVITKTMVILSHNLVSSAIKDNFRFRQGNKIQKLTVAVQI